MDLITDLPTSNAQNDSIFVVVDRLTKMVHLIPIRKEISAVELSLVFFKEIFRLHGLPKVIVSDRDPRFTSIFWKSLFKLLGT